MRNVDENIEHKIKVLTEEYDKKEDADKKYIQPNYNNFNEYIDIALNYKIYKFDSSILNIGGCPFSGEKNISNMNTLELIKYLDNKNYNTSIDFNMLEKIEKEILNEMEK